MTKHLTKPLPPNAFGLRRQLTYEEVAGLLDNSKLFSPLPQYPFSEYRDSFEGSQFDNINERIDLLKDQQQRINERQIRNSILRNQALKEGGDYNLLKAQDASVQAPEPPQVFDIGDDRSEASEMMSVMSFGRQRAELEERVNDFLEQEQRDREAVGSRIGESMSRDTDTVFHNLARQSTDISEPQRTTVKMPEMKDVFETEARSGRPRDITDFSTLNPDVMSFGRLKGLFDSAIKKTRSIN